MNKSSKKTLSLILVMVLLVCMIPTVASAAGTQELLGSEVTVASGWQYAAQINSTNWGGTFTPDTIKPGSYLTVTFTGENIWGVHLMFKGAAEGQIDHGGDAFTTDADGNYVTTFTYAEMLAINGTEDFSGFNAFMLYTNSGDGVGVTVKSMTFTVPETSGETTEETTTPAGSEVYTPVGGTLIDGTEHTVTSSWTVGIDILSTLCGGTFDYTLLADDGYFTVTYTGTKGEVYVAAQDNVSWGWFSINPASTTENSDGSFTSTFTREAFLAAYGGEDDFSDLGKILVGTNNITGTTVIRDFRYYKNESAEDPTEETTEETTEGTTVAPGSTIPEGTIMLDGNTHEQPNKWTIIVELLTTKAGGTIDPAIFAKDGKLAVTYTGTEGALYLAMMDATAWQWVQTDSPSETVKNEDGSYTSYFTRSVMSSIYKGVSDFSDLGKLILGTGETSGTTTVTDISWIPAEQTPSKSYTAKLGYAAAGDWEPNEWGDNASTTVTGAGTYTITWNPASAADGAEVFVIDIIDGAELYKTCRLSALTVTADGVDIPVDLTKVAFGDLEYKGNLRIELFNAYGANNPALDLDELNFSESLVITFTLQEDTNPKDGDEFHVMAVGIMLLSAMAIVALTVSRKKWLA